MSPQKITTEVREEISPKIFAKLRRRRRCSEFLLQMLIMRTAYDLVYWIVVGAGLADIAKVTLLDVVQVVIMGAGLVAAYYEYCRRKLGMTIHIYGDEGEKVTIPSIILMAYRSIKAYLPEELVFSCVSPYPTISAAAIFVVRAIAWKFGLGVVLLGCVIVDAVCYFWLLIFFVIETFSNLISLNTRRR